MNTPYKGAIVLLKTIQTAALQDTCPAIVIDVKHDEAVDLVFFSNSGQFFSRNISAFDSESKQDEFWMWPTVPADSEFDDVEVPTLGDVLKTAGVQSPPIADLAGDETEG